MISYIYIYIYIYYIILYIYIYIHKYICIHIIAIEVAWLIDNQSRDDAFDRADRQPVQLLEIRRDNDSMIKLPPSRQDLSIVFWAL